MKLKLIDMVNKYIGAPHKLGGGNYHEGYDCFSLVLAFGEDLGVEIPEFYGSHTLETYPKLWEESPEEAKEVMLGLFGELAEEIPIGKAFVTDILLLEKKGDMIVGIHAGNGLVLSSFIDVGVQLSNISSFEVKGVYRWAGIKAI